MRLINFLQNTEAIALLLVRKLVLLISIVRVYAGLIAEGFFDEALRLLKTSNPIPASLGRICPHPCEDACRRGLLEAPVSIAALKRFTGDIDLMKENPYLPELKTPSGKEVAVIGGGPAGLTAAWLLAISGHKVTVFEAMPKAGVCFAMVFLSSDFQKRC